MTTRVLKCVVVGVALSIAATGMAAATGPAKNPTTRPAQQEQGPDHVGGWFLRAIAEARYDDALALTSEAYREGHPADRFKQGFEQMRKSVDLTQLDLDEAWSPELPAPEGTQAMIISTTFEVPGRAPEARWGLVLRMIDGTWRVRDVDFLPQAQSLEKFRSEYRESQKDARQIVGQ